MILATKDTTFFKSTFPSPPPDHHNNHPYPPPPHRHHHHHYMVLWPHQVLGKASIYLIAFQYTPRLYEPQPARCMQSTSSSSSSSSLSSSSLLLLPSSSSSAYSCESKVVTTCFPNMTICCNPQKCNQFENWSFAIVLLKDFVYHFVLSLFPSLLLRLVSCFKMRSGA